MMKDLRETALDILEAACETDEVREGDDMDLFEAGILDSIGMVSVIVEIEKQLGITLQPTDLQKEDVKCVNNFVKYHWRKLKNRVPWERKVKRR